MVSYNNIAKKKILQFSLNYFRQQMFQIEIVQLFDVGPPSVIPLDFQYYKVLYCPNNKVAFCFLSNVHLALQLMPVNMIFLQYNLFVLFFQVEVICCNSLFNCHISLSVRASGEAPSNPHSWSHTPVSTTWRSVFWEKASRLQVHLLFPTELLLLVSSHIPQAVA